ncbi:hypothetical protein X798_02848 [Onchocerca flexuosa]|uniref:Uncharacterized protein n=1 Tax=Onchocerca flexuosa TaxID=387005 RepID=A0A238BXI9_9BILA|nr:hypothetical protein X798_02848 [Onchocerca flexuosa]
MFTLSIAGICEFEESKYADVLASTEHQRIFHPSYRVSLTDDERHRYLSICQFDLRGLRCIKKKIDEILFEVRSYLIFDFKKT